MFQGNTPFPRLRWALRHPLRALDRSGFGPWQTAFISLFTGAVGFWAIRVYLSLRR